LTPSLLRRHFTGHIADIVSADCFRRHDASFVASPAAAAAISPAFDIFIFYALLSPRRGSAKKKKRKTARDSLMLIFFTATAFIFRYACAAMPAPELPLIFATPPALRHSAAIDARWLKQRNFAEPLPWS